MRSIAKGNNVDLCVKEVLSMMTPEEVNFVITEYMRASARKANKPWSNSLLSNRDLAHALKNPDRAYEAVIYIAAL